MNIFHFLTIGFSLLFATKLSAAIIVKADSVAIAGVSNISADKQNLYAGIAGPEPIIGTSNATVDTCALTSSVMACNKASVHSTLKLTVRFQVTKDISNTTAKLFLDSTQLAALSGLNLTANNTTVTLETDWGTLCTQYGLASCQGTTTYAVKNLKFGVDDNASGDVDADELKSVQLHLHYIAPTDTANATQAYCASSAAGVGICNLKFIPGDQKVFIDSALYAGNDGATSAVKWESIAIFPVASNGNQAGTMTGFFPKQATPIFKTINADDGTIPDSAVSGGDITNGVEYCFVYGTRNLTGNIYKFVNDAAAAATACITPSEVVGVLGDKSCFISTAAFGSEMAPEVQTFRKFRDRFLLTNSAGRIFVKKYYAYSPPMADIISHSETLRLISRLMLYPPLFYAQLALDFGIGWATAAAFAIFILLYLSFSWFRSKTIFMVLFALIVLSPSQKSFADQTISHEGASEGLVRIQSDGTYVYDLKRPLKKESSRITFGMASQPDISIEITKGDGNTQTYNFENFYEQTTGLILGYDYENFIWKSHGKLGYQLGGGIMFANGNGILVSTGQPSAERFTFLTVPVNAGAVYRFEYKDKQAVAPYVAGGATLLGLLEKRDDVAKPNISGGIGFYGVGGLLINAALLEPDSSFQLESEYGISNLWITLEFRVTEVTNEAFSFSNQYVNGGLSFDF